MDSNLNELTLRRSLMLSQPFWAHYKQLIGPTTFALSGTEGTHTNDHKDVETNSSSDSEETLTQSPEDIEGDGEDNTTVDPEYLAFIKITRQHQAERDRLKELESRKKNATNFDEYYKDISQVDTLIEDNLVEPPNSGTDHSQYRSHEQKLVQLYGSQEAYNNIRVLEMQVEERFNKKLQELTPKCWPIMPINPKPYLNPMR